MAKSYIKKAIDKTLEPYESSKMGFSKVDEKKIEELRNKLYSMIIGNEEEYKEEIDERLNNILSKSSNEVSVNVYNKIPKNASLNRSFKVGKAIGVSTTLVALVAAMTVSCGAKKDTVEKDITPSESIELDIDENVEPVVNEKQTQAEQTLIDFSDSATKRTTASINSLLANGVKLINNYISEDEQKELLASEWLQYYLVANIDNITTLEYANFMKEQPGAVLDNDDLIYNFREMNVLLKGQMLVCTPENKIDFSNIYNETDAKLLNDGADILARLNSSNKSERKEISKEFYDYIQNTILNQTDKLKYSNSAMATFINTEFGAWCELTKNSNYKIGYYPDDELEAKLMTVISNCGMSSGEKATLDIEDETKKSLESINVIRTLDSLNSRKENISSLFALEELFYKEEASFGNLKSEVSKNVNLDNYKEIESFTEKKEKEIKNTKPQVNKNDSQISNGQGGTIAKDDMIANSVNPTDSNAKEKYEEAVEKNFEEKAESTKQVVNSNGEVIDPNQASAWAQQGAIDANNGTRNYNVPAIYQEAYNNGWNAANNAKQQADQNIINNTTTENVSNEETIETTVEETYEGFKESNNENNQDSTNVPSQVETPNENPYIESETTFVPVEDGETIIEETEEVVGFGNAPEANAERNIEVKTLKNEKVEAYKELKNLLQQAMNSYQDAINIYDEIKENNMSK